MAEIRILALFFSTSEKIHDTLRFIHSDQFSDHPIPTRDRVLQLARGEIVEIKVSPVAAFGEPDHLVGTCQVMPVRPPRPARFILRIYFFFQHIAYISSGGVRYPQGRLLVVSCTG